MLRRPDGSFYHTVVAGRIGMKKKITYHCETRPLSHCARTSPDVTPVGPPVPNPLIPTVNPIWAANWVSVNPTSTRLMRQTPVSPSQGMIPPVASQLAINLPSRDTAKPNTSLGCPTRRFNTFFVVNSHRQTVLSLELVPIRRVSGRTATADGFMMTVFKRM